MDDELFGGTGNTDEIFSDATNYDDGTDFEDDVDDAPEEDEEQPDDADAEQGADPEQDDSDADAESPEDAPTYTPDDYVGAIRNFAAERLGLVDADGNPVDAGAEGGNDFYVNMAQRYESQLKFQKLENDMLRLSKQDEDFDEVAPSFAQTVLDMPELLSHANGADVLYNIAKANYIQKILPQVVEELVQERTKATRDKQAFQTKRRAGGGSGDGAGIADGIMAEAQRRAKLL